MQSVLLKKVITIGIVMMSIMTIISPFMNEKSLVTVGMAENQSISYQDQAFNQSITRIMSLGHFYSLSACIIKENNISWVSGYGHFNMDQDETPTLDTIFLIASISKTVTATALLQLYEQGFFGLDDDVNNRLDFPLVNPNYPDVPITYRMLLNHTSSLENESASFYNVHYLEDPPNLSTWLQAYFYPNGIVNKHAWTRNTPGTDFLYNNMDFCILARLVELWSNQSFNDYCKKNIFDRLDMKNTSFLLSNISYNRIAVPYIRAYIGKGNEPELFLPIPPYSISAYPAGGLRTTVSDLSHFLIAHMNGGVYHETRILNPKTIQKMHNFSSYMGSYLGKKTWYGLGWEIWCDSKGNPQYMGHEGSLYGFTTSMRFRVSDNTGFIFFLTGDLSTSYLKENMKIFNLPYWLLENLLFVKACHIK